MKRRLSAAALALAASPAFAFTPESGFYWYPTEYGSGLAIEIQDNYVFLAGYVYDVPGNPTWFTAQGTMTGNSAFTGVLDRFTGGQCIGCAWSAPNYFAGAGGPISISWQSETTANLTWGGRTIPIQRFNFDLGDPTELMLGEWQVVLDLYDLGGNYQNYPYYGDVLVIDRLDRTANPDLFEGCRAQESLDGFCTTSARANHDAAGFYQPASNPTCTHTLVVTDDPGTPDIFIAYYMNVGTYQFDGVMEIYQTGDPVPTAPFYPVRGFRSASRTFVETGSGPSSADKAAAAPSAPRSLVQALRAAGGGGLPKGLSAAEVEAKYGIDVSQARPEVQMLIERLRARRAR
jgi:hypothetical protein